MADDVLYQGICGITNLITNPGMINLDFADIKTVMANMGNAMMGTGESSGENRAKNAHKLPLTIHSLMIQILKAQDQFY